MSAVRVTGDDLALAAEWLRSYEDDEANEVGSRMERVAAWLDAEVARRAEDAAVRQIVADLAAQGRHVPPAEVRKAYRAKIEEMRA